MATTEHDRAEITRRAAGGESAAVIARALGLNDDTVRNTARRLIPSAFRKGAVRGAVNDNIEVIQKRMPHQVSWSTDPTQSHLVTLPRLACLS
ncbi:hypothetical protein [Bosea sp. FBZP-16]|uniref:hypothetical protein n=1 Tax=Bosea sp. FBZP-16 TaxID=2065382 RepID=UPI001319C2B9|nr:hypothetical protein [Bosea sp. FBZP-16]